MFGSFSSVTEEGYGEISIIEFTPFIYGFSQLLLFLLYFFYFLFFPFRFINLESLVVLLLNYDSSLNILQFSILRHHDLLRINRLLLLRFLVFHYFNLHQNQSNTFPSSMAVFMAFSLRCFRSAYFFNNSGSSPSTS